jgi:hypothetical protein
MHRLLGTIGVCAALILVLGSGTALAFDSPQKYGVELRGGFGVYDMGDITPGIETLRDNLNRVQIANTLNSSDAGPAAGLSLLYRPSKHTMWEVGYNALMEVENTVDSNPDTASGEILMHGSEFFVKGNVVITPADFLNLNVGAGLGYYGANLQIQDRYGRRYNYDAKGRAFGLIGSAGIEVLPTPRLGIVLSGGARVANAKHFTYETTPGTKTSLTAIGSTRSMEVNLSGFYGSLGLRFYFDKVTKPVDFSR